MRLRAPPKGEMALTSSFSTLVLRVVRGEANLADVRKLAGCIALLYGVVELEADGLLAHFCL